MARASSAAVRRAPPAGGGAVSPRRHSEAMSTLTESASATGTRGPSGASAPPAPASAGNSGTPTPYPSDTTKSAAVGSHTRGPYSILDWEQASAALAAMVTAIAVIAAARWIGLMTAPLCWGANVESYLQ